MSPFTSYLLRSLVSFHFPFHHSDVVIHMDTRNFPAIIQHFIKETNNYFLLASRLPILPPPIPSTLALPTLATLAAAFYTTESCQFFSQRSFHRYVCCQSCPSKHLFNPRHCSYGAAFVIPVNNPRLCSQGAAFSIPNSLPCSCSCNATSIIPRSRPCPCPCS